MPHNASNRSDLKKPIEKQTTAAWADINKTKKILNVQKPDVSMIENAKEYVDENEK